MDVQQLADRAEIADLITAYTRAVDTKDPLLAQRLFTDDATIDYTSAGGPVAPADDALNWVWEMLNAFFDRWQHLIGQLEYTFDGPDEARVTAYFFNPMVTHEDDDGQTAVVEVGGYYHHELVRTPNGWRSRRMVDEVVWTR